MSRHFAAQAEGYRQFRPEYPTALFNYLAELCAEQRLAWDCGTGSGQAALALAGRFAGVLASDTAIEQLRQGPQRDGLWYVAARAEQVPLAANTVDLISVAQAMHWFDTAAFLAEVTRILRPGGVVAIWSYQLLRITPAVDAVIDHLYGKVVGRYWPAERRQVEQGYADLSLPWAEEQPPPFAMQAHWSYEHLVGYLRTWSAYRHACTDLGTDPFKAELPRLHEAWGDAAERQVRWPLTLRVARRPA